MKTKFIETRSEISAGTRGASLGNDAIRVAAWTAGSDFFAHVVPRLVPDRNDLLNYPIPPEFRWAKRLDGVLEVYGNLIEAVKETVDEDSVLMVLAAAHGTAGATIKGLKAAYPDKRLGVVWIDAHGDLHSPYTTPSGNIHGMPLAVVLGEDNLENRYPGRELPERTTKLWNELKEIGTDGPAIQGEDVVLIAARDLEIQERRLIEKLNIQQLHVRHVREDGFDKVAARALEHLKDCDHIYITFDVDSMDNTISVGTGTPVANGLIVSEAKELLKELVRDDRVSCVEFVEVNPTLDLKGNKMAEAAFKILSQVVDTIHNDRT